MFQLAEGPFWDSARRRLHWVDITLGALFEGCVEGSHIDITNERHFGCSVTAVVVAADGTLGVVLHDRIAVLHTDGGRSDGPRLVMADEDRRCNDASTDPRGRLLVGTMPLGTPSATEVLVRIGADGRVSMIDDDVRASNGLAWNVRGTLMYNVDTGLRRIHVREYDAMSGSTGPRRTFVDFERGLPDGIAIDADDHVWVAVWGCGEVRRYAPDGRLAASVAVPAANVTSVAFCGDDLRTLIVTTAAIDDADRSDRFRPHGGRLFTIAVETPGTPVPYWTGLNDRPIHLNHHPEEHQ